MLIYHDKYNYCDILYILALLLPIIIELFINLKRTDEKEELVPDYDGEIRNVFDKISEECKTVFFKLKLE